MSEKESPEYVQISTAAAMTLKFFPGQFNRGEKLRALNLLVTYGEGCRASCGYCGLSRTRGAVEDTFIRVDWPIVPLDETIRRANEHGEHVKRVCVSMITHPKAFDDMLTIMRAFRDGTDLLISGLIGPTLIRSEEKVEMMKEAGADMVGIAVDAATPELFDKFRGGGVGGPHKWEHYWRVVDWSARILGRKKPGVHLIVGLGETEREMVSTIQRADDLGAITHLFSFFPEAGSSMERWSQPSYGQYRRVQLARYLINEELGRYEDMEFNEKDQLVDFRVDVEEVIDDGEAFMTSGCAGHEGRVACNRPYGNERPSRPIRNYAFLPEPSDIEMIREQLFDYSGRYEEKLNEDEG